MKSTLALASLTALAAAGPMAMNEPRQACPGVHVFGARETTVSPGYGTAGGLVNQVLAAYSGSTAEAISYPACGGQSSCGGVSYDSSQSQGTQAVVSQMTAFNQKCPSTQLVYIGYSQGGQIGDTAICGGGSATLTGNALNQLKAAVFLGSPRYVAGLSWDVGTCTAQGFAARPKGFTCASASKLKQYCDAADPYCCTGSDANTHQQYVNKYGAQALAFIKSKIA